MFHWPKNSLDLGLVFTRLRLETCRDLWSEVAAAAPLRLVAMCAALDRAAHFWVPLCLKLFLVVPNKLFSHAHNCSLELSSSVRVDYSKGEFLSSQLSWSRPKRDTTFVENRSHCGFKTQGAPQPPQASVALGTGP